MRSGSIIIASILICLLLSTQNIFAQAIIHKHKTLSFAQQQIFDNEVEKEQIMLELTTMEDPLYLEFNKHRPIEKEFKNLYFQLENLGFSKTAIIIILGAHGLYPVLTYP